MLYLLAIFFPPVAVLLTRKPLQAFINLILCFFYFIPGVIHAIYIVYKYKSERSGINQAAVTTARPITQTEPPRVQKKNNILTFNVAGVSYANDKGKKIQPLLRKIAKEIAEENGIPAYSGYTNKEILNNEIEVSEFEDVEFGDYVSFEKEPDNKFDKNAIKVLINLGNDRQHIGYVPKTDNVKVGQLMDSNSINYIDAVFVGGKVKEVEYDDDKGKDIVGVNELTLGVELTLDIGK
ncbi:YqaE/Pmp3 family membrane protein [Mesobacillus sp.]|uniref:YqaE/Pmp3 family membrane protein n=1 Tax=Mesobacillus sp. TaxID=2675271 RepID=UPI0039EF3A9B